MKQEPAAQIDMEELQVIPINHIRATWLRRHGKPVHAPLTQCVPVPAPDTIRTVGQPRRTCAISIAFRSECA
jgi:hypothetical protein